MGLFSKHHTDRKQSTSDNESSGTTTPSSSDGHDGHELTKTQSRLKRMASGFHRRTRRSTSDQEWAHLNKPLTRQNMEHQKMLNAFEWNFGRRGSNISNISPCGSRAPSFDWGPKQTSAANQAHAMPQVEEIESAR